MALFKIFKGSKNDLGKIDNITQYVREGFAYFTPDDGKFYIDTAGSNEPGENNIVAQIGVNRIPLNAYKADQLSADVNITVGNTIQAFNGASDIAFPHPLKKFRVSETAIGWYKIFTYTFTAAGTLNITAYLYDSYSTYGGIFRLYFNRSSSNTYSATLRWLSRGGFAVESLGYIITDSTINIYAKKTASSSAGYLDVVVLNETNRVGTQYTTLDSNWLNENVIAEEPAGLIYAIGNYASLLTAYTLDDITINNTAGNFAFKGSSPEGGTFSSCDWAGIQIDSGNDKFQITTGNSGAAIAQGATLLMRSNDSGGSNSTNWTDWKRILHHQNVTWADWGVGTTEGPTAKLKLAGITIESAAIPSASITASGIITTGNQEFQGLKTFGYLGLTNKNASGTVTQYMDIQFRHNTSNSILGEIYYNLGSTTNVTKSQIIFKEGSPNTTADTDITGKYEYYQLPAATPGLTDNNTYQILTTKNTITIAQGGTGATTAYEAITNLGNFYFAGVGSNNNLVANDDLDDKRTVGTFISANSTISEDIINTPTTGSGYKLLIGRTYQANRSFQFAMAANSGLYYRDTSANSSTSTWNSWHQIAFTDSNITGNAATATAFSSNRTITLTGAITGSGSSNGTSGWSIETTIPNNSITNNKLEKSTIGIAGTNVALGSSISKTTLLSNLGLTNAAHYIGKATKDLTDGGTENPFNTSYTPQDGDIVLGKDGNKEYIWGLNGWELLGPVDTIQTSTAAGEINHLAYYSASNMISSVPKITYFTYPYTDTTNGPTGSGNSSGLKITETSVGGAANLKSGNAALVSYGDSGPQIRFASNDTGILLYHHYNDVSDGGDGSFHFLNSTGVATAIAGGFTSLANAANDTGFRLRHKTNNASYGFMRMATIGTTTQVGNGELTLGNSTPEGTDGNARGSIYLYGANANWTGILAQSNGNRTFYLPNYAGNGYFIHAASNDAVGSPSQPVYIAANGRVTALNYTIESSVPANAKFTDTNTHYTSKNIVGASATATANAAVATSVNSIFLNHLEENVVKSSNNIVGTGLTTVASDANGKITINSSYTPPTATASANGIGRVVAGTGIGVSYSSGAATVSNSGVRSISTGTTNGTISVNTNGTSANVSVYGLGSAAYTASTDYAKPYLAYYANQVVSTVYYITTSITASDTGTVWVHGEIIGTKGTSNVSFVRFTARCYKISADSDEVYSLKYWDPLGVINTFTLNFDSDRKVYFSFTVTERYSRMKIFIDKDASNGNTNYATEVSTTAPAAFTKSVDGIKQYSVLANSGATAGSYGPSANATPGYGDTFNVPYISVDAKGRITEISTKTVKIPASDNTDTKVTQSNTTASTYRKILLSSQNAAAGTASTTDTDQVYKTPQLEYLPSEGRLWATGVSGKSMEINVKRGDYSVGFGFGSRDKNHGLYSWQKNDWMIYADEDGNVTVKGNSATATKVNNNLAIKINTGTTEGTSLYTFNGSAAKTLDIKPGTGISLTAGSGTLTINHSNSITADTVGTSSATSGVTLAVPYITYDAQGHITAKGTHTHTIPAMTASANGVGRITAGTNIAVSYSSGNVTVTNSGVRAIATGTANGTISVNTNGTSANVAVYGLGSAAYTNSTEYLAAFCGKYLNSSVATEYFIKTTLSATSSADHVLSGIMETTKGLGNVGIIRFGGYWSKTELKDCYFWDPLNIISSMRFLYDSNNIIYIGFKLTTTKTETRTAIYRNNGNGSINVIEKIDTTAPTNITATVNATKVYSEAYVRQSASTTSSWRKVLLHATTNSKGDDVPDDVVSQVYAAKGIEVQPSSGILAVNRIHLTATGRYKENILYQHQGNTIGFISMDLGNDDGTTMASNRWLFYQYSPKTTADSTSTGYRERYALPVATAGLTTNSNSFYDILTTKNTITVAQGGTGASSFTANSAIISGSTTTGALTTRAITNNTSATAVTASTNLITANTLYYHKGNSNIVTVGTISSGTWQGTTIGVAYGGTGQASWTKNQIIYASAATTLAQITHASSTSYLLKSGSSSAAPSWIQYTNANTASTIVQRDASGNFSAGTITASLSGNASTASGISTTGGTTGKFWRGDNSWSNELIGNLLLTASDTSDRYFQAANTNGSVRLYTSTNRGVYDSTNSQWMLMIKSADKSIHLKGKSGSAAASTGAEALVATYAGSITYSYNVASATTGLFAASDNANAILTLNKYTGTTYASQLGFSSNGNIYYRNFGNAAINTTTTWKKMAFMNELVHYCGETASTPYYVTTSITVTTSSNCWIYGTITGTKGTGSSAGMDVRFQVYWNKSTLSAAYYKDSTNAISEMTFYTDSANKIYFSFKCTQYSRAHINVLINNDMGDSNRATEISTTAPATFSITKAATKVTASATVSTSLMPNSSTAHYILGVTGTTADNSAAIVKGYRASGVSSIYFRGDTGVLMGAAWNDYAEFRQSYDDIQIEPGRVVKEVGDDTLELANARLQRGCQIVSDTYGFGIGENENNKLPLAVSGRVLAYPYESLNDFKECIGWPVCSGPGGTVSIMTEEEEIKYPSRIIGTISAVPDYEVWHGGADVIVDGRVWIKVR